MQSKCISLDFTYSPELKLQAGKFYVNVQSYQSISEQVKIQSSKRIYL